MKRPRHRSEFVELVAFLSRIPAIGSAKSVFGSGRSDDGRWWVKLSIDISHPLAWSTVQELAHVLNYLSVDERLPTVFMPVSPPPYANGGPQEYLSWVIECHDPDFTPSQAAKWLSGRLPDPVDKLANWPINKNE